MSHPLDEIPNLGSKSIGILNSVGIRSRDEFEHLGSVVAFLAGRQSGQSATLNLLWSIAAGLEHRGWRELTGAEKHRLFHEMNELTC